MLLGTILLTVMLLALGGVALYWAAAMWADGDRIMAVLLIALVGSAIALLALEIPNPTVIYVVIPGGT